MEPNERKRGPYRKWTGNTKVPRQTVWSRSKGETSKRSKNECETYDPSENNDCSVDEMENYIADEAGDSVDTGHNSDSQDPVASIHEGDVNHYCTDEENSMAQTTSAEYTENANDSESTYYDKNVKYVESDTSTSDDDSDESSENADEDSKHDTPLYSGSRLTIATSMLLILTFSLRHGLTGSAIHDLLALIELHCLSENLCQSTVKLFYHLASQVKKPMVNHYFCGNCSNYFAQEESSVCPLCTSKDIRYFITVPLTSQLESILSRQDINSALQKRLRRQRTTSDIEDVYDGKLYNAHFDQDGFFCGSTNGEKKSQLHLSLQVNTDGVSLFKTSRFGIWPIYGIINELPPSIRFHRDNRLFMGLWFGDDKPQMNVFFTPVVKELHDLYHQGTNINNKTCRVIVLSSVADAPARSLMLNCMQFNGQFGCSCCYASGERLKVGTAGGFSRVYPYDTSNEEGHAPRRMHGETIEYGEKVDADHNSTKKKNPTPEFGIKGSTVLRFLPLYDVIRGTTIDYMHCVFLGVTKMFLSAWFDSQNHKENWSLRKSIKVLSQRLISIQPPSFIKRMPRPFEELSHWKASEFQSFLLFFSLPVLSGILEEEYLAHWMLLSQAIYILSGNMITQSELQMARTSLKLFCLKVKDLYGARYDTFNTHCLLHLCDKVSDLGPLWAHSCFYFEGFNGELRLLFHGTTNIQTQIMRAVCIQQAVPDMVRALPVFSSAKLLYEKMTSRRKISKDWTKISDTIFAIGSLNEFKLPETIKQMIMNSHNVLTCFRFLRLSLNGQIVQSMCYQRVKRRMSYAVAYNDNSVGYVMYYVKVAYTESCVKFFAIVQKLNSEPPPLSSITHIVKHQFVKETEEIDIVPVDSIKGLCMSAPIADHNLRYVLKCPNTITID